MDGYFNADGRRREMAKWLIVFFMILVSRSNAVAFTTSLKGTVDEDAMYLEHGDTLHFNCCDRDVEYQRIDVGVAAVKNKKINWTLSLCDTVDNHTVSVNVRLIELNKYDFDHQENILVTLTVDGKEIIAKDCANALPISKSPVYLRVLFTGEELKVMAGPDILDYLVNVPFTGFVDTAALCSRYDIKLIRHSALYIPIPDIPSIYADEAGIYEALKSTTDPRCGIYDFFDEEVETKMALKGGRYRLALVPGEAGEYNLIYVEGAVIDAGRWQAGKLKGRLVPTPFADNYTLYWIDSSGKEINDCSPYITFEGMIMNVVFPLQKAKFRFVKNVR